MSRLLISHMNIAIRLCRRRAVDRQDIADLHLRGHPVMHGIASSRETQQRQFNDEISAYKHESMMLFGTTRYCVSSTEDRCVVAKVTG